MSKQEILIDQIINIADGLSTDALDIITERLMKMEETKIKEVLKSITPEELSDLVALNEDLQINQDFNLIVEVPCNINLGFGDDGTGCVSLDDEPYFSVEHITGTRNVNLQSTISTRDMLKIPEIKAAHTEFKRGMANLNQTLKHLSAKYKLKPDVILQYAVENAE